MEVITMDTAAYMALTRKIDAILDSVSTTGKEEWLDNQDICKILKISKRTLQNYRDAKIIPYYKLEGKILYKFSEIEHVINNSRH